MNGACHLHKYWASDIIKDDMHVCWKGIFCLCILNDFNPSKLTNDQMKEWTGELVT